MFKIIPAEYKCQSENVFRLIYGNIYENSKKIFEEFSNKIGTKKVGEIGFLDFIIKNKTILPKHIPTQNHADFKEGKALIILTIGIFPKFRSIKNLNNIYDYIEKFAKNEDCELLILESPKEKFENTLKKNNFIYCPHFYKWVKKLN